MTTTQLVKKLGKRKGTITLWGSTDDNGEGWILITYKKGSQKEIYIAPPKEELT